MMLATSFEERQTVIGDKVREVVFMVDIVVFNSLSIEIHLELLENFNTDSCHQVLTY